MLIAPWLAAAIPPAVSAIGGFFGQERANVLNQREAAKNRQFQAQQASQQMDFQERMRNTAWQAAVADMEAAGLNPALALSHGGAATPGGASGGGAQAAVQDSVSSALQAMQMRKSLQLLDEQVGKTRAEKQTVQATERVARARSHLLLDTYPGREMQGIRELVQAEIDSAKAGATNMAAMSDRNRSLAQIAAPLGELSEDLGKLLPVLSLLMAPGGAASGIVRQGGRLLSRRSKNRAVDAAATKIMRGGR